MRPPSFLVDNFSTIRILFCAPFYSQSFAYICTDKSTKPRIQEEKLKGLSINDILNE